MTADLDRTTAAILAADQAHLARVHETTTWARRGFLAYLTRGDVSGRRWARFFARRSLS